MIDGNPNPAMGCRRDSHLPHKLASVGRSLADHLPGLPFVLSQFNLDGLGLRDFPGIPLNDMPAAGSEVLTPKW